MIASTSTAFDPMKISATSQFTPQHTELGVAIIWYVLVINSICSFIPGGMSLRKCSPQCCLVHSSVVFVDLPCSVLLDFSIFTYPKILYCLLLQKVQAHNLIYVYTHWYWNLSCVILYFN